MLGPLWHIVTLSFWGVGVGVVYGRLFDQDMSFFLPYLTVGFVLWGALTSSLIDAGYAFINSEGYIKQFARPRQIYVLRYWLTNMLIMAMGMAVAAVIALVLGRPISVQTLWFVPGLVLFALIAFAHSSIVAHLTVFARDLPHFLGGLIQVLFFVTPIIFTTTMLEKRGLQFVYQFNPLWYAIEIVRYPIIHAEAPPENVWMICALYFVFISMIAALVEALCEKRLVYEL